MRVEDLRHPVGAFAAGRALAARLVRHEPAAIVKHVDHARLVVDHHHRRGAEAEAAGLARAVEIERRVELVGRQKAHADSARHDGLRPPALPHAAAVLVDQLAGGDAQRQLDAAGAVDVPADAVQLRAVAALVARIVGVGRHADRFEPIDAALEDVRHATERFDVVDDRRLAEQAFDRGERRLDPRPGPLAFEAFDQAGLLAADVRPAPRWRYTSRSNPLPGMFLPSRPAA